MIFEIGKCYKITSRNWLIFAKERFGINSIKKSNIFMILELVDFYLTPSFEKFKGAKIEIFKVFCDGEIGYLHINELDKKYYEAL